MTFRSSFLSIFALATILVPPPVQAAEEVILDEELIALSLRTAQLAAELNLSDDPSVPGGIVYIDEPDAAIFLQEDSYCFGIFRGTTPNIQDWIQNLNPFNGQVCSTKGECCTTRKGFQDAYDLPDFKDTLESNLRGCKANCNDCQVVLAGHSQGGAIASIAAVAMDDLDPTVIAFGQPGSIVDDCAPINVDKYYRFVNTVLDGRQVNYDPVPYLNFDTDHRGHLFIMGDDDHNLVYYKDGIGPSTFEFGWKIPAHDVAKYIDRMASFQLNAPLSMQGWRIGAACSIDEECVAPQHCVDYQCHEGMNGDPCKNKDDCDSGRCVKNITSWFTGECSEKLQIGEECWYHSDCKSSRCSWWKCA